MNSTASKIEGVLDGTWALKCKPEKNQSIWSKKKIRKNVLETSNENVVDRKKSIYYFAFFFPEIVFFKNNERLLGVYFCHSLVCKEWLVCWSVSRKNPMCWCTEKKNLLLLEKSNLTKIASDSRYWTGAGQNWGPWVRPYPTN